MARPLSFFSLLLAGATILLCTTSSITAYAQQITSLTPNSGSILGGTRVSILGTGFDLRGRSNDVYIGTDTQGVFCDPIPNECHDKRIVCITAPFEGRGTFPLRVRTHGVTAECKVSWGCTFSYDYDRTPVITGVSPEWITTPQSLTITGTGFDRGDRTIGTFDMYVYLGDEERCDVGSNPVSSVSFVCDAHSGIFPGTNRLSIMFGSRGWAINSNRFHVLVIPTILGVAPATGSIEGGQQLTIFGTGFSRTIPENVVTVHGAPCVPTVATENYLVCTTSAHSATELQPRKFIPGVRVEYWARLDGAVNILNLRSKLSFLNPEVSMSSTFGGAIYKKMADRCAVRVTGYFVPNVTGAYNFSVLIDDLGELWMSEDENPVPYVRQYVSDDMPFNDAIIANREKYYPTFTTPTTRHLVAGKRYWMQAYVLNVGSVTRFSMNVTYPDGSWDVNPSDNFFYTEDWAPPVTVTSRNVSAMAGIPCMNYSTCDFHYTSAATAVITAVSPASIKGGETLTLTGADFPAPRSSVAVITIGGVQCSLTDMTTSRIRCVVAAETPVGVHNVQLFVAGSGKAVSAAFVTVDVAIVSVDNTKGYTRIVAPSIATIDAATLSVTVGGKPCTAVEIVGNEVHCAAASGTSGSTTATITVQQQRKMTIQKGFTYAQKLVRPGTTTALRPPMLVTTEGSMGGQYPIIIVVPQWTLPANASGEVLVTLDGNPCVVTDALASRITCIAPSVTSIGNKVVTVAYKGEKITIPGYITITHEVTSMNPKMLLSPSGGNMLEIKHDAIMDGTPIISWRGVPCKAIDKQSHTSVRCYIDDSALTKKITLPVLSEILPSTPNANRLLWGSDDVRFTAGGFVIPKGGYLFTRRSFDTSLRVTATIIPSTDNDCVSLSAHSPDPTTDKGGVTGFAKDGKFYIARDSALIWGSAVSNTAGMPAQTTATWTLEVNSGYSSLYINGEYVAGTETSRLRNGFVGFPPACQDITVTSIKIEDLTPDGLVMSIDDEPVGMNFEPPLTLSAPDFTVVQPPTQILAGTDTVSLTVRNYDDVFELFGFPKGSNDFQLLPTTPQLCKAKVTLEQKFTTLAYVKCDANDVPAGSYQVRLRHYRRGFSAQKFNVDVIPVVRSILTPTISYYGGYIRISVYGAGGATSDWTVTIGNSTACPVSHTMVGSFIECRAPAATSETALGPFAITVTHKPTKTTMTTTDSLTYMTAASSPVITSFGPIVSGDTKVPFAGTNYGTYGTFEIGSVLCQVWNADRSCSFGKVFPNPGTYAVKYHARLLGFAAPTGLTVTITRGVTTPTSPIAAASGSTLRLSGSAIQPFNGLSTTVASFDYTKGRMERDVASRWTVTNGDTSALFQCGSLWSEFGGMNMFDSHTLLTRTLTGLAAHTFIGLEFDIYYHAKWNSQSIASFIIDGTEYTVPLSQNAYSTSNSGILSRCGAGNGELDSRVTLVVPHTRSTMKIEFRGLIMGTSSGRSWGLKSYRVLAGTPSLQVTVGGSSCRLQQVSLNTIACTLPRKANGTVASIVVADGSNTLACDGSCSVLFTDAKAPSITAVTAAAIPARHTGRSITWSNLKGIDSYRNGLRASLTRYANSPDWSGGAISQQWFRKSDGLRGLRCRINGSAQCGLTPRVMEDGSNPNIVMTHGIYTESTQVVAMDDGSWRFKLGPYGYDQVYEMIINDDDTVTYLIDGVTRFMTNWKVQWPLHVATTVMGSPKFDSSVEVEPLFDSDPSAAEDAPIIISGPNIVAGAVAKVNNVACPPVVPTVGAIICYIPRAQAAVGSVLSVGITSDGTTLPAASFTVAPNIDAITPTKGSTLGSHLVTISGGGFSVKPTVTIGGVPCMVRSYDYGSITCLTGAHIAESSAAVTVSVSGSSAVCSRASRVEPSNSDPAEPCPVYTYEEPSGSIGSTSIDNSKRIVTVAGVIPKRSGIVSLLLGNTLLSATESTESSATIAIPTTIAAGTYNAVVMTEAAGSLGTAAVSVPFTVAVSPARIGALGGAVITFSGSNFGPLDGLTIKNGDNNVCSSLTLSSEDANTVLCVTAAGTFTSVTIQTSQGASKVVAVEASSSSTPTITSVIPTTVSAGSMITVRGSNLDGVTGISVGGVQCEGPSGSATALVCRVGGVASGALSVQITAGAKGSSAAFSGVSGAQSVWTVTPERAPAGSTVTIHGSAFEQSKSYTVTIGGLSCGNVAVASTSTLTCTIQYPAKFVDGSVDVEVKVAAGTVATASASYLHTSVTTPVFAAVSPSSGSKAGGDTLTITGSGFSDDVQQVNISVGGVRCMTTFASPTEVHCTTDPMPLLNGATTISLSSQGIPAAATKPFTVRMAVTGISPSAPISVEGGVDLTLTGTGFPDMVRPGVYGLAVTVGYIPCPIVSTSRTKIVCTAPARPYPYTTTVSLSSNYVPRGDGTGVIRVAVNGTIANVDDSKVKVEWRQDASPTVTNVASRSTVRTGDSLTITGTDFAASGNRVDLVEYKLNGGVSHCNITSESTSRIICSANLSTFGRHFVRVQVPNKGYAYTSQSCPSGQYMMCDGSCIGPRDCSYTAWGFEANCDGLLGVFVHDTYCHSNGGSDRVDQPFLLDNGKALNLNCPMYSCEGKDCNATITIGGFGGIVSTCGKDPMGYMIELRPSVSSVRGSKSSGINGGNRLTIVGTNIDMNSVVRLGDNGAFCTPVEVVDGGIICETSAFPQAITDLEMIVFTAGSQALCGSACQGFSYTEDVPTVTGTVEPAVNRGVVPYYAGQSVTITGTGFSSSKTKNIVAIGGVSCAVSQATSTQLICVMGALSTGDYQLSVRVDGVGLAGSAPFKFRVRPTIYSINDGTTTMSMLGGATITVTGSALDGEDRVMSLGRCDAPTVVSASMTQLVLRLAPCSVDNQPLSVAVSGSSSSCQAASCNLRFRTQDTPSAVITAVGDNTHRVLINSSAITTLDTVTVQVGFAECTKDVSTFVAASGTFECDAPATHAAGTYPVTVIIRNIGALISVDTPYSLTYDGAITSVSPASGSLAGGQRVTITGSGFATQPKQNNVTLAGFPCPVMNATATELICNTLDTKATTDKSGQVELSLVADYGSGTLQGGSYSYLAANTPTITSVSPNQGSTAGGTLITIKGTNLASDNVVTISGVLCAQSESQKAVTAAAGGKLLVCTTGAYTTSLDSTLFVTGPRGAARGTVSYQYIDLWSRWTTWGNNAPPGEGDSAVISEGQTVMYNYNAPRFHLVVVMGHLMFEDSSDLLLRCTYIMINFGRMTVGTPENPFTHKATIRLYGDRLTPEIPVHGSKVLALRHGALDMHGVPRQPTWTMLAAHARAGETSIKVRGPVDWKAGEEIAIASSSFYMDEAEVRHIVSVSQVGDVATLQLDMPLNYYHNGVKECFDNGKICIEEIAEVALLTRNIVVEGDSDSQTIGFGGTMFLMPMGETNDRYARLSFIELRDVGQEYIVGRYPVHYHVTGSTNTSYVNGTAVHRSLNRAFSIHGISNNTYVNNVVYDTKGHAFFIEDGSEKHNVIKNNLVIIARTSTSNLNTDITPACFWVVSPLNYLDGNHAAGCGAYGFWIAPFHPHSTGPTYSPTICPSTHRMWHFENNVAHGAKKYGLNIFQYWWPKEKECDQDSADAPAVIRNHFSWKNKIHGVSVAHSEVGEVGAVSFDHLVSSSNGEEHEDSSAFWIEHIKADNMSVGLRNSVLIAQTSNQPQKPTETRRGVNLPLGDNFYTYDTTFVNYDGVNFGFEPQRWAERLSFCFPWGWEATSRGLRWVNSPNRIRFRFPHHGLLNDEDGSLAGTAGTQIIPTSPLLSPTKCQAARVKTNRPASVCANDYKLRRFGVDSVSEYFPDQLFTCEGQQEIVPVIKQRYSMHMPMNSLVNITFLSPANPAKWTWTISPRFCAPNEKIMIQTTYPEHRDHVNASFGGRMGIKLNRMPTFSDPNSSFYFDNKTGMLTTLLLPSDGDIGTVASTCPWDGCSVAPSQPTSKNEPCRSWDDPTSWASGKVPVDGADLRVNYTESICLDNPGKVYHLRSLLLEGKFEVNNTFCNGKKENKIRLVVDKFIHVRGGILQAGTEETPFDACQFEITIKQVDRADTKASQVLPWQPRSLVMESGTIDLHGAARVRYATLVSTAAPGATTLALDRDVDWQVGERIGISMTRMHKMHAMGNDMLEESENATITAISGRTITLDRALQYEHSGSGPVTLNGKQYVIGAEVVLMNRNIHINGGHADEEQAQYGGGWNFMVGCTEEGTPGCGTRDPDEMGYPMGPKKLGTLRLNNVQFSDMGAAGALPSAFSFDGLITNGEALTADGSYVTGCAFYKSYNTQLDVTVTTKGMIIANNSFYSINGDAIRIGSRDNVIEGNLVIRNLELKPRCDFTYEYNDDATCVGAAYRINWGNKVVGNIAASGLAAGFMTYGEPCDQPFLWKDNIVHNHKDGLLLNDMLDNKDWNWHYKSPECRRAGAVLAYRNADSGVATWSVRGHVTMSNVVTVENSIGVSASLYLLGNDKGVKEYVYTLEDSTISGHWPDFKCSAERQMPCAGSLLNSRFWCETIYGGNPLKIGHVGILETFFIQSDYALRNVGEHKFRWTEPDSYATLRGRAVHKNLFIDNFAGTNDCGQKEVGFMNNIYSNDTFHQHTFEGIRWGENVPEGGETYAWTTYGNILGHKTEHEQSVWLDFDNKKFGAYWPDSPNKFWIVDKDGSFTRSGSGPAHIFGSKTLTRKAPFSTYKWDGRVFVDEAKLKDALGANREGCAWNSKWNAHKCGGDGTKHHYVSLAIDSLAADKFTRRAGPVVMCKGDGMVGRDGYPLCQGGEVDFASGPVMKGKTQRATLDRLSRWRFNVENNQNYTLYFRGQPPVWIRYVLTNYEYTGLTLKDVGITINLRYFGLDSKLRCGIYVDGVRQPSVFGYGNPYQQNPPATFPMPLDPPGTHYHNKEVKDGIEVNVMSATVRPGTILEFKQEDIVIINMDVSMNLEDFFNNKDTFVAALVQILGIEASRVRFARIVAGTAGRHMAAQAPSGKTSLTIEIEPANHTMQKNVEKPMAEITTDLKEVARKAAALPRTLDTFTVSEVSVKDHTVDVLPPSIIVVGPLNYMVLNVSTAKGVEFNMSTVLHAVYNYTVEHLLPSANATNHTLQSREVSHGNTYFFTTGNFTRFTLFFSLSEDDDLSNLLTYELYKSLATDAAVILPPGYTVVDKRYVDRVAEGPVVVPTNIPTTAEAAVAPTNNTEDPQSLIEAAFLSAPLVVAIAVVSSVMAVVLIGVGVWLYCRRRRIQRTAGFRKRTMTLNAAENLSPDMFNYVKADGKDGPIVHAEFDIPLPPQEELEEISKRDENMKQQDRYKNIDRVEDALYEDGPVYSQNKYHKAPNQCSSHNGSPVSSPTKRVNVAGEFFDI